MPSDENHVRIALSALDLADRQMIDYMKLKVRESSGRGFLFSFGKRGPEGSLSANADLEEQQCCILSNRQRIEILSLHYYILKSEGFPDSSARILKSKNNIDAQEYASRHRFEPNKTFLNEKVLAALDNVQVPRGVGPNSQQLNFDAIPPPAYK